MNPPSHTTLITPAELRGALAAGAATVVIDVGFDLADTGAGERRYREAHLPGAPTSISTATCAAPRPAATAAIRCRRVPTSRARSARSASRPDAGGRGRRPRRRLCGAALVDAALARPCRGRRARWRRAGMAGRRRHPDERADALAGRPALPRAAAARGDGRRRRASPADRRARRCSTPGPASAFAARSSRSTRSPGISRVRSTASTRPTSPPAAASSRRPSCAPSSPLPSATARRAR